MYIPPKNEDAEIATLGSVIIEVKDAKQYRRN